MLLRLLRQALFKAAPPPNPLQEAIRLFRAGRIDETLQYLERCAGELRNSPDAHALKGAALSSAGRHDAAVEALSNAVALAAERWDLRLQLAQALLANGAPQPALESARKALRLNPKNAHIAAFCGDLCEILADTDGAAKYFEQSCRIAPTAATHLKLVTLVPAFFASRTAIHAFREKFEQDLMKLLESPVAVNDPLAEVGHSPAFLAYQGENDRRLMQLLASVYLRCCPSLRFEAPHAGRAFARDGAQKIRLGVVSMWLAGHTLGSLIGTAVRRFDRERFDVTVFLFGAPETGEDELWQLPAGEIRWLPLSLSGAQSGIAAMKLDALWFVEASLSPMSYFLAFSRLAPVQFTTWGHPVTSGIPTVDYFLSSENVEPRGFADHYAEKVWLVSAGCSYTCTKRPVIPTRLPDRNTFGLPAAANLYVCLQSSQKLHPDFDPALRGILETDPAACIVITDTPEKPAILPRVIARLAAVIGDEKMRRVQVVPFQHGDAYFQLLALADVVLDPPHFGAGKTSFDAFALGLPVVTWPGAYARSRYTLADYRLMDMRDLVASNAGEYVSIATKLGTDKAFNKRVRDEISGKANRLFDDTGFVRELENFVIGALDPGALAASRQREHAGAK